MTLPIWFLVLGLFLPRIALIVAFFTDGSFPHLFTKWLSVPMGFFMPRVLILIAIGTVMGLCPWFWIHLGVALIIWLLSALNGIAKMNNNS